ncbi:hypothetical protein K439DRAFT_1625205 [Ramaria rubella]|nr:hypothetical protein K439DRAFT_1625205 [Ramaria rubella]
MWIEMQTTPHGENISSISPSPSAGPYAQSLSPYYQAKLIGLDAENRAKLAKEQIRKRDAKADKHVVRVKWWQHMIMANFFQFDVTTFGSWCQTVTLMSILTVRSMSG